jgi:amidohydrolase
MKEHIKKILPSLKEIRHQIHTYPELRYEENVTAAFIKHELEKMDLTVLEGIGKTGVVAVLDSGKEGKTVALRADMDALPIQEETHVPYQSKYPGKMHACGHDGHVASLIGVAKILNAMKDSFSGKIKFIFQPAEEGGAGALAMIKDGVLENPSVDVIFGYHNYPKIPTGNILARAGCTMYGNTEFSIQIHGKGGHAAIPELSINPIVVSSIVIQTISQIMTQYAENTEPTVITITQISSGVATNVIPDLATLSGTIRAASSEKSKQVQNNIRSALSGIEKEFQVTIDLHCEEIYPPTINSKLETDFVLSQAKILFGESKVAIKPASGRASEDFSYFLQQVPGCYFFIGNGENSASCHNSSYNFNDDVLPVAVELMSHLAITYLNKV